MMVYLRVEEAPEWKLAWLGLILNLADEIKNFNEHAENIKKGLELG